MTCACVNLVLCECIGNASVVLLIPPAFDDNSALSFPPHWMVYPPGSTLGDCLLFSYRE